jgi:hypothetical protein
METVSNLPLRFGGWASPVKRIEVRLTAEEIARARRKDSEMTEVCHTRTMRFVENSSDPRWIGATVYYPWVFEGDPQYHVYVARGGRIETIWVFDIVDGSVSDYANFYFDQARRSIPPVASTNLKDSSRWFHVSVIRP